MNLQLFAQEKTEKATPRRRQKARERGQVFSSKEFTSALILLASFLLIKLLGSSIVKNLLDFIPYLLKNYLNTQDIADPNGFYGVFLECLSLMSKVVAPIAAGIIIIILVAHYVQTGFAFSLEPLMPRLNRINPIEGLKRIFSKRSIVELLKSIIKILLILNVTYNAIHNMWEMFPLMLDMDLITAVKTLLQFIFNIGIKVSITLLILSLFDYLYQFYEYEMSLMMSKEDIKEELKEVEGNPQVKSRIRQIQRQMSRARMLSDVKKADVVITNPTHIAIAIVYDSSLGSAPVVLAKGQDYVAERIKQIAQEQEIPIVENKPLAQALYKSVEIGHMIPEELYQAVAEILAFVYSLRERRQLSEFW